MIGYASIAQAAEAPVTTASAPAAVTAPAAPAPAAPAPAAPAMKGMAVNPAGSYSIDEESTVQSQTERFTDMQKLEDARLRFNESLVKSAYYQEKMKSGEAFKEMKDAEKAKREKNSGSLDASGVPTMGAGSAVGMPVLSPQQFSDMNMPKEEPVAVVKHYGPNITIYEAEIVNFKYRIAGADSRGEALYLYKGDKYDGFRVKEVSIDSVTFTKKGKSYIKRVELSPAFGPDPLLEGNSDGTDSTSFGAMNMPVAGFPSESSQAFQ